MSRTRMRTVGALCRSVRFSRINSPGILMSDSCFRHFAARSGKEPRDANYRLVPRGIFRPAKKNTDGPIVAASPFIYSAFCRLALAERGRKDRSAGTKIHWIPYGRSRETTLKMRETHPRSAFLPRNTSSMYMFRWPTDMHDNCY